MSAGAPADDHLFAIRSPDLILLLLAAPGGRIRNSIHGITRLEKLLFLLDQESEIAGVVEKPFIFDAYDYGPYSKEVYQAVDMLAQMGLIEQNYVFKQQSLDEMEEAATTDEVRENKERRFTLTPSGEAVARLLEAKNPSVAKAIAEIKSRYCSMSLRQLIQYVYTHYPRFAVNSKIRKDILGG